MCHCINEHPGTEMSILDDSRRYVRACVRVSLRGPGPILETAQNVCIDPPICHVCFQLVHLFLCTKC